jgi:6-phosphogluconolactonase (cycloisomerase 2 family)
MVKYTILAGGFTSFIVTYVFNSDDGSLILFTQSPTGPNASWIASHPTNGSILYAVNGVGPGALQSFTVNYDGSLTGPIDQVSSGGKNATFAGALSTGQVAVVNYSAGTGMVVPTTTDGLHFDRGATTITFTPPSTCMSHPHMTLQHGNEVFVPDKGADKIWRLVENSSPGNWKIQGFIPQATGSGPRHIRIYNEELYTLHELDNTLTLQQVPAAPNGTSAILANVTITPPNPPAGAKFAAGEILIPTPTSQFPVPYIYVSNRNIGTQDPRGDTIAIYERTIANGNVGLTLITHVYTGLDQIRGMEFGLATNGGDEYLIAGGCAGSGGVVIFRRTDGGRGLEEVVRNTDVPTRTSFVWL